MHNICQIRGFLDGTIHAYDTRSCLSPVGAYASSDRPSIVTIVRYSADGGLLACGTADGKVIIWDRRSTKKPQQEFEEHTDSVGVSVTLCLY